MRRRKSSFPLVVAGLVLAAAFCAPSLMASQIAGWSVVVANNAVVDHGKGDAATPVMVGASIGTGDRLTTGDGGALVLTRGEDLVTMAENSQIEIVDPQPSASTTLIDQPYGHVEYHVTKEQVPHFQVDAPLLATVVKGTTFSVDASASKSSVTVSEGRVVAKNRRTGASSPVSAGERGAIESRDRGVDVGSAPNGGAAAASSGSAAGASSGDDGSGTDSGNSGNDSGNGNGNGNSNSNSGGNGNGNGHGAGKGNDNGNGKNKVKKK